MREINEQAAPGVQPVTLDDWNKGIFPWQPAYQGF